MGTKEQIDYWIKASELDFISSTEIFNSGKNFHYSLFIAHLCIEKLLKAFATKELEQIPPKTHNLLRLAEISNLSLNEEYLEFFEELNQFQLQTRYPDEKFNLYKKADYEFTKVRIEKLKEVYEWLKSKL
ncbi:MAG: DNA-binding protein [Ignavibacteriae bacterium]|nr:DNA-binding protein [Ignavibacteriota bacterium]|tara:strand:+ start:157 stop:546 length:390 start_codon:yes stop_codon:yes gene_type:complete